MQRLEDLERRLADLRARIGGLRDARADYPEEADAILDAALSELTASESLLQSYLSSLRAGATPRPRDSTRTERERKLLRHAFGSLPVPAVLLDPDGTVRRANTAMSRLLAVPQGYLAGKSFSSVVDTPHRAAFQSHLAGALSAREAGWATIRLHHGEVEMDVRLALGRIGVPGEPRPMVAVVVLPGELPERADRPRAVEPLVAAERRLALMYALNQVLLGPDVLSSPVYLSRTARLLAPGGADWVVIDMIEDGVLRRAHVEGPDEELVRLLGDRDPAKAPAVRDVLDTGGAIIHEHIGLDDLLGEGTQGDAGELEAAALGSGSAVCVPMRAGDRTDGVLTLVRSGKNGPFSLSDLGFLEHVGEHLAGVIGIRQSLLDRDRTLDDLRTCVEPVAPPVVPGFETGALRLRAAGSKGLDFYDVFRTGDAWMVVVGRADGGGHPASAGSLVRSGIRLGAIREPGPAEILQQCGVALGEYEPDVQVRVVAGAIRTTPDGASVTLASAGHACVVVLRAEGAILVAAKDGDVLGEGPVTLEELQLAVGDTLVMCSPGLLGSEYGRERLTDALVRHTGEDVESLVHGVVRDREEVAGAPAGDVTVLALRVA